MNQLWLIALLKLGLNLGNPQETVLPDAGLVVISNDKGAPSEMKMSLLKSTLKGEKQRWPNGTKVIIALMKSNTLIGENTSKKLYNMSANELNKYWLALVFQGKADAPNFFNSESDLAAFVGQTQGAIGVIGRESDDVRPVLVDGKKIL